MQIKWSKRQRFAIEKVIKHYEYVLEDLKNRVRGLFDSRYCPFCQMYICAHDSKCPNRALYGYLCEEQPLMKKLDKNIMGYRFEHKRGSEKWLRKAILARIEFWQGQLG